MGQDVLAGRLVRASVRRHTRLQVPQTGECFRKIKLLIFLSLKRFNYNLKYVNTFTVFNAFKVTVGFLYP